MTEKAFFKPEMVHFKPEKAHFKTVMARFVSGHTEPFSRPAT